MILRIPFLSLAVFLQTIASVVAGTLIVKVDGDDLVPLEWVYIDVATRLKVPGCLCFDFLGCLLLGEGGFYPRTFYSYYDPSYDSSSSSYSFETECGFWKSICRSELDEFNNLRLEYKRADNTTLEGSFRVVPGGPSNEVGIQCSLVVGLLECEDALIAWDEDGTSTIRITMNATVQ